VAALSAAGEAVAGYCMEQFGYQPLVRPLGVMPDAVLWANRAGMLHLALTEAKASTRQEPKRLLEKSVSQFFLDIKTRAVGFSYHYEGYLVASQFKDGHVIECACLHVDLGYYTAGTARSAPADSGGIFNSVPSYDQPEDRIRSIMRLQAETGPAQDEYLTSLFSEEATRSATLALMKQDKMPTLADRRLHREDRGGSRPRQGVERGAGTDPRAEGEGSAGRDNGTAKVF
jgi:hypothetical protein